VPLHLTKVAYGCDSIDYLQERLALKAAHQPAFLTTRYLPKRHEEIVDKGAGGGSLFWIIKHQLIGRSPILGFGEAEGGRVAIYLEPRLVLSGGRGRAAGSGRGRRRGLGAAARLDRRACGTGADLGAAFAGEE
jgi:hypothetical protein